MDAERMGLLEHLAMLEALAATEDNELEWRRMSARARMQRDFVDPTLDENRMVDIMIAAKVAEFEEDEHARS